MKYYHVGLIFFFNFLIVTNFNHAQEHPKLYFDQQDVIRAQERMNDPNQPDFMQMGQGIINSANNILSRDITIFERKGAWTHLYICDGKGDGDDDPNDGCGGSLLFDVDCPDKHLCPRCGTVYTGDPYDQAWISHYNNRVAQYIITLGLAYQLTEDEKYAEPVRELVLRYAELYPTFPVSDVFGGRDIGRAKLFSQTLDEAVWILNVLWGLDSIWSSGVLSDNEKTVIEEDLLRGIFRTISLGDWGRTNIQSWITSAIGAIGFFLEDDFLMDVSITGKRGFNYLMENSYLEDGFTFEGSIGYHYFSVSPLIRLVRIAETNRIDLWSERFHSVTTSPLYLVQPNGDFPRYNDAGRSQLRHQTFIYELANGLSDDLIYDEVLTDLYVDQMLSRREFLPLFVGKDYEHVPVDGYVDQVSESIGIETFRSDTENPTMLFIDRGPHGGYHGHNDKLNIVLYGQSRELMSDLGSASLAEGLLTTWLRRTVSHNTISVGEIGQNEGPETLNPLLLKHDDFSGMKVISIQAAEGVYPPDTNVTRSIIKVEDDYSLVFDSVINASAPIDILWHSLGIFQKPDEFQLTDLESEWQNSSTGYQHFQPPRLLNESTPDSILSFESANQASTAQWHLPIAFSDNMDDISIWYGTGTLSEQKTEGKFSQRFLALPNRHTSIGKDLTHPDFDWDHLTSLTFDYFLEGDKTRSAFLSIQDPERRERFIYDFEVGAPNEWHTLEIDLTQPTRVIGVTDDRFRFEITFFIEGEKEDSFFVYIDNIQAYAGQTPEDPLLTGLATQVITEQDAQIILADGPTLRPDEFHGTQIVRVNHSDANVTSLLETYGTEPRWNLQKISEGHYLISSSTTVDDLKIDFENQSFKFIRHGNNNPQSVVMYQAMDLQSEMAGFSSEEAISLQADFDFEFDGDPLVMQYETLNPEQHFQFTSPLLFETEYLVDGEYIPTENGTLTLPGGSHEVRFFPVSTKVMQWEIYDN